MKIKIIISLVLFCSLQTICSQNNSIEELGISLLKSVKNDDIITFKSLIIPFEIFASLSNDNNTSKEYSNDLKEINRIYDVYFVNGFEDNFNTLKNKIREFNLDLNNLKFKEIKINNSESHKNDPKIIYTKIKNSKLKHFYFYVNEHNGKYYLTLPKITLSKKRITIF